MRKGFTSIIVPAYDMTPVSAHITMACLANIAKYTDPEDYELILIEEEPPSMCKVRDDYGALKIDNHILLTEYMNYSTKMNTAAKQAKGEYLCFIQNDVFVWEGWLDVAKAYFESGMAECLVPDQFPRTREYILNAMDMTLEEGLDAGARDACAIFITADAFKRTGGFNENLRAFVEADFYSRCDEAGVIIHPTNKIQITHITLATHYQDMEEFDKKVTHDSLIRNHGATPTP